MITIDLRNLTPQHFAEAEAGKPGGCQYEDPCIIGTLIPEDEREKYHGPVFYLIDDKQFYVPDSQQADVGNLQNAFDRREYSPKRYKRMKEAICQKYKIG